jgi:PhoD-like phosphatase
VWVETDAAREVEILGRRERTFAVAGHHYALVVLDGLEAGAEIPYEVALDGERVWPPDDDPFPRCTIRTASPGARVRLLFGSCRGAAPHEPPYTLSPDEHELGREVDALWAFARRLAAGREERPDLVLQLGDQVYVDELAPRTRAFIRGRRDVSRPPGEQVLDFEEYAHLYRESWSDPAIRWLFSTVPTATIWDDHDVHDDWNTSLSWVEDMRRRPWWHERIRSAIASYWVYQHLGNLSPADLAEDEVYARVRAAGDATELLFAFAVEADRETAGKRWSYSRPLGGARLVVVDSRGGRLLGGRREMVDDEEWRWIEERASEPCEHLVLGTSLPFLLPRGADGLQRWDERVCAGGWGRLAARVGERIRRALDLEHWAAFGASFAKLERLLGDVAAGRRGAPPATVVVLSGDVHYSYLARVERAGGAPIYQATCSPLRNPLERKLRLAGRLVASRVGTAIGVALQRLAGVADPAFRWRLTHGPWFDNVVGTLELEGRRALVRIEKTVREDPSDEPRLELVLEQRLA